MIKRLSILLLALVPTMLWAQFPPASCFAGTTAMHADSSAFVAWATGCAVERGPKRIDVPNSALASFGDETLALGKPGGTMDVVSLGDGGTATLTFDSPIFNGKGPDFAVFENGLHPDTDSTMTLYFLELAFVEVSSDGEHFFRFPAVTHVQSETQLENADAIDPSQIHNFAGKYEVMYGTPFDLDEVEDDDDRQYYGEHREMRSMDIGALFGSMASEPRPSYSASRSDDDSRRRKGTRFSFNKKRYDLDDDDEEEVDVENESGKDEGGEDDGYYDDDKDLNLNSNKEDIDEDFRDEDPRDDELRDDDFRDDDLGDDDLQRRLRRNPRDDDDAPAGRPGRRNDDDGSRNPQSRDDDEIDDRTDTILERDQIDVNTKQDEWSPVGWRTIADQDGNEVTGMLFEDGNGGYVLITEGVPGSGIYDVAMNPSSGVRMPIDEQFAFTRGDLEAIIDTDGGYIAPGSEDKIFADNDDIENDIIVTDDGELVAQRDLPDDGSGDELLPDDDIAMNDDDIILDDETGGIVGDDDIAMNDDETIIEDDEVIIEDDDIIMDAGPGGVNDDQYAMASEEEVVGDEELEQYLGEDDTAEVNGDPVEFVDNSEELVADTTYIPEDTYDDSMEMEADIYDEGMDMV